jgi:hypothetical protein
MTTASALTPSDVVYLFGESFADKDSWRTEGIVLESSGVKVQKRSLVHIMALAAMASLLKQRQVELTTVKKGFLIKSDAPALKRVAGGAYDGGGLEAAILAKLHDDEKKNSIDDIVVRLVGGEQPDPWNSLANYTRSHLVQTGYFWQVDNPAARGLGKVIHSAFKMAPNAALISSSSAEVNGAQALLDEARKNHGKTWESVAKSIEQGLKSCQPKQDTNDD